MNTDFANYLSNRFMHHYPTGGLQNCQLRHVSKNEDQLVRLLFPLAELKFYQTLHIGRVRLTIRSYSEGKVADDSNIIFLLHGIEHPGKIRSIFTIDDGEPYLLVAYITNLTPLTCEIDENENFVYPNICFSSSSKWDYVPIEVTDFIEKNVYFRSPTGMSYFLRHPTLEHCS
jgi:hypothetical protein